MSLRTKILDKLFQWVFEAKISPLAWINGHKTTIGTILTSVSAIILAVQQALCVTPPLWEYCGFIDQSDAFVAFLVGLLVKITGETHKGLKKDRGIEIEE